MVDHFSRTLQSLCGKSVKASSLEFLNESGNVKLDALAHWLCGPPAPFTRSNLLASHFSDADIALCSQLQDSGAFLSKSQLTVEELLAGARGSGLKEAVLNLEAAVELLRTHRDALATEVETLLKMANSRRGSKPEVQPSVPVSPSPPVRVALAELAQTANDIASRIAPAARQEAGGVKPLPWPSQFDLAAYLRTDTLYLAALQGVSDAP